MSKRNTLIIGFGSIGRRHAIALSELGCRVFVVTKQTDIQYPSYRSISDAMRNDVFDYVVIANETHLHHKTLKEIVAHDFLECILVEKPLFSDGLLPLDLDNASVYVGYNLRFHPVIAHLKNILYSEKIISFSAGVGQYLPTWRSNIDYRNNYSAKSELGGGVLRDLSHELDYCTWICGDCKEVAAIGGKFSDLEINSEDTYTILMRCQNAASVVIHMDYLSRAPYRHIRMETMRHTYYADLLKNQLSIDGVMQQFPLVNTYEHEHRAILENKRYSLCTYQEGLKLMKLISQIEFANHNKTWVFS